MTVYVASSFRSTPRRRSGVSYALALGLMLAASPLGAQPASPAGPEDPRPALLFLADPDVRPELVAALQREAAYSGYRLSPGAAPDSATALQRASDAQRAVESEGAEAALWVEAQDPSLGAGALLRAIRRGSDEVRHAPLPDVLERVDPRTFAAVAGSLLDEIIAPPEPLAVRVRVSVDVEVGPGADAPSGGTSVTTQPADGSIVVVTEPPAEVQPTEPPVVGPPEPPVADTQPAPEAPDAPAAEPAPESGMAAPESGLEAEIEALEAEVEAEAEALESEIEAEIEAEGQSAEVEAAAEEHPTVMFGGDVVPLVGTSMRTDNAAIRRFSLNLLGTAEYGLAGLEVSGLFDIHRGDARWFQLAGLFHYVGGDMDGVQLAGGLNYVRGRVRGAQLSPGVNIAGDVVGLQVGSLNVARGAVDGVQVGLINYAHDVDFALGLINIVRDGRTHIEVSGRSDGFIGLTLKHGGDHFHYDYGVLVRPSGDTTFGAGLGLGARITSGERLFLDFDVMAFATRDQSHWNTNRSVGVLGDVRLALGVRLFDGLALVAGASYSVAWDEEMRPRSFGQFGETLLHEGARGGVVGWPNIVLGLQVL